MPVLEFPQIDFQHLFLLFIIYSFVGWICETIWVFAWSRKLEYRGMLFGPICPIYGFGALMIIYGVYPFRTTWIPLFLASVVLTSTLEYVTHWALEKIFHAMWWDYSKKFMNLNGRICLLNSCAFGVGGVLLEHFGHPFMMKIVYFEKLQAFVPYIFAVLLIVFVVDWLLTIKKLVNFATTMEKIKGFEEHLKERFENEEWFQGKSLPEMLDSVKERAKTNKEQFSQSMLDKIEHFSKRQKNVEHWFKRFSGLKSREYEGAIIYAKILFQKEVKAKKEARAAKKAARKQPKSN